MKTFRYLFVFLVLLAPAAQAWGPAGHRIVGAIAELHLTDKSKTRLAQLIGPDQRISDDAIASWPDHIRKQRPETAPWHYVDIPITAPRYDSRMFCPRGQCVVSQIDRLTKILADSKQSTAQRTEALRFLVHFVGDIHQPLHCAQRDDDKGGNLCKVYFLDRPDETNLHRVWDGDILHSGLGATDPLDYARRLNSLVTPDQLRDRASNRPADWAWESHELAVTHVYAGVPAANPPARLTEEYVRKSRLIVDHQLTQAGLRLARLLNRALGD